MFSDEEGPQVFIESFNGRNHVLGVMMRAADSSL